MKKKIFVAAAAVLAVALAVFAFQPLLVPKYIDNPEGRLVGEYYSHKGGHDVLFLGDCEIYESFVPAILWEEYGITSYVRGSAQQLPWHSYYLLKETLSYEKPKAVVFNVYSLKYGTPQSESYNRMTFDTMKWSWTKLQAINASKTEGENLLDYIFPFLRYHDRITELKSEDFEYYLNNQPPASYCGYLMQTGVAPLTEENKQEGTRPDSYTLPSEAFEYLDKIYDLCKENGIELILVKAPTQTQKYWWYDEWEEQVVEYKNEKGIAYYNFIKECDTIGIDWNTDTYDEGLHLNVLGAEKLSVYFGKILQQDHGIENKWAENETASVWDGYLDDYYIKRMNNVKTEENNK